MIKKAKRVFGYVETSEYDGHYLRLYKTDILYLLKDIREDGDLCISHTFSISKFTLREDGDLYIN